MRYSLTLFRERLQCNAVEKGTFRAEPFLVFVSRITFRFMSTCPHSKENCSPHLMPVYTLTMNADTCSGWSRPMMPNSLVYSSRLRSGAAHCPLSAVVQAGRGCPLLSRSPCQPVSKRHKRPIAIRGCGRLAVLGEPLVNLLWRDRVGTPRAERPFNSINYSIYMKYHLRIESHQIVPNSKRNRHQNRHQNNSLSDST